MRHHYTDTEISVDVQKAKGFSKLHSMFCNLQVGRWQDVKDSIEDIWDMVTNRTLLHNRMKTLANKDIGSITPRNLLDIALIAAFLWNDTTDD